MIPSLYGPRHIRSYKPKNDQNVMRVPTCWPFMARSMVSGSARIIEVCSDERSITFKATISIRSCPPATLVCSASRLRSDSMVSSPTGAHRTRHGDRIKDAITSVALISGWRPPSLPSRLRSRWSLTRYKPLPPTTKSAVYGCPQFGKKWWARTVCFSFRADIKSRALSGDTRFRSHRR